MSSYSAISRLLCPSHLQPLLFLRCPTAALACLESSRCPEALCALLRRVKGRSIDDVMTIKNSEIAKHLSLPPVKLHCSMLAEDAIKAAVKDIQAKRAKAHSQTGGLGEEKMAAAGAS